MNEKSIKNNGSLTVDIKIDNPCHRCNGDCDSCPYWIEESDYSAITAEAEAFRLSLSIDLRKHDHIEISL